MCLAGCARHTQHTAETIKLSRCSGCRTAIPRPGPLETTPIHRTKEDILKAFLEDINKRDGVTLYEAIIMAQTELIFRDILNNYHFEKPQITTQSPARWGIRFHPRLINTDNKPAVPVQFIITKNQGQIVFQDQI